MTSLRNPPDATQNELLQISQQVHQMWCKRCVSDLCHARGYSGVVLVMTEAKENNVKEGNQGQKICGLDGFCLQINHSLIMLPC